MISHSAKPPASSSSRRTRRRSDISVAPFLTTIAIIIAACFALQSPASISTAIAADSNPNATSDDNSTTTTTTTARRESLADLRRRAHAAFSEKNYDLAERTWRTIIDRTPNDFVPWYNLACIYAITGRNDEAHESLRRSIAVGFSDLPFMQRDPHLRAIRNSDEFRELVDAWPSILEARIDANLEAARTTYGPTYTYQKDPQSRLAYISAFDTNELNHVQAELKTLTQWWNTAVLGQPENQPLGTQPNNAGQPDPNTAWVTVFLPNQRDYARWALGKFGQRWQSVGGAYLHDEKLLAASDLGSSLRHEFWHVLHWRHMDALGQRHPPWIMEGLCSLVEDTLHPPATRANPKAATPPFEPLPSWRTNSVRRLAIAGRLMPWDALFAMAQHDFTDRRPLAQYAQSRAIFLFLHERGKLADWYNTYTEFYQLDKSGKHAFERVFDKPIADIERDFINWARELPEAPEQQGEVWNDPDNPARTANAGKLPFSIDPSPGDGLRISSTVSSARSRINRQSGLRLNDVITDINNQPVRDMNDLARILSRTSPGDRITVAYRRGSRNIRGEAEIELVR